MRNLFRNKNKVLILAQIIITIVMFIILRSLKVNREIKISELMNRTDFIFLLLIFIEISLIGNISKILDLPILIKINFVIIVLYFFYFVYRAFIFGSL